MALVSHLAARRARDRALCDRSSKLQEPLGKPVGFIEDCVGEQVEKAVEALKPGEILLIENVRFYRGGERSCIRGETGPPGRCVCE
jgi:3-phosphoglycerate kinase